MKRQNNCPRSRAPLVPLAVVLLSSTVAQSAGLTLSANAGFDNRLRAGHWAPVWVTLENRNHRAEARVEVSPHKDSRTALALYTRTVALDAPARKRFAIYVPVPEAASEVRVRVRAGRAVKELTLVPEMLAANESLQLAVYNESSEVAPKAERVGEGDAARHRAVVTPADLPDRWFGYDGVDAVVLGDVNVDRLRPEQIDALQQWVASGGELLVLGGRFARGTRQGWLKAVTAKPASRFGLGKVRFIDDHRLSPLSSWKPVTRKRGFPDPDLAGAAAQDMLPKPPPPTHEWIAAIAAAFGLVLIVSGRGRNRRAPGVIVIALSALGYWLMSPDPTVSINSLGWAETTSGSRWAYVQTRAALGAAREGARELRALDRNATLRVIETPRNEASQIMRETDETSTFMLPGLPLGGALRRQVEVERLIDLGAGIRWRRAGDEIVIVNDTPLPLVDCIILRNGKAMWLGNIPAGSKARMRPTKAYRFRLLPSRVWQQLTQQSRGTRKDRIAVEYFSSPPSITATGSSLGVTRRGQRLFDMTLLVVLPSDEQPGSFTQAGRPTLSARPTDP